MTKAILSVGAILAAAVALAGCGGSGSASGGSASGTVSTPAGTTSGVAGVSTTKTSTTVYGSSGGSSFNATASGLAAKIQKSVKQFANGNLAGAASSGASLLRSCNRTVSSQLAPRAENAKQQEATKNLRLACADMKKADKQGMAGNLSGAKTWALQAARKARLAAKDIR